VGAIPAVNREGQVITGQYLNSVIEGTQTNLSYSHKKEYKVHGLKSQGIIYILLNHFISYRQGQYPSNKI